MYERRPENDRAIERAWAILEDMRRGDLFAHEQAEVLLGVRRPDERYYRLIDRLKTKLEDQKGIAMISVPLVGYVLGTAKEQLGLARFRTTQAARRLRKGARHAAALPEEDCSFTELRAKQAIEEKLSQAERSMRQEAQRIAFLMRPRDDRPPRLAAGE